MNFEQQMGDMTNDQGGQMQMSADEILQIELDIQQNLAGDNDKDTADFIDNHADDFRNFIKANRYILEKYKKDPEATLKQVKSVILH